jgi:hypothetical protein
LAACVNMRAELAIMRIYSGITGSTATGARTAST